MDSLPQRAAFLRALGDPTRLRLLRVLSDGELTVAEITRITGLSQPRVSRHLKLLSQARLLGRTPDQNEVYYRVAADTERRRMVDAALQGAERDATLERDRQRLQAILGQRRATARALLEQMGVRSLSEQAVAAVGDAIEALLGRHFTRESALGDLLDVGTGAGTMLQLLGKRATTAVAIDRSREMRVLARTTALAAGLANCTVREGDMYALGFEPDSFDVITMDRVLGAAEQPQAAVEEAARVLRPGGHLLVVEAAGSPVQRKRLADWTRQAGLAPVEVRYAGDRAALVALSARPGVGHARARIPA
jgi:ArsR family transcriptional regulator